MDATYNRVPKCRICQKNHWLRDGCTGDFQKRQQPAAPRAPAPAPAPKPRRKAKKRKAK